MKLTGRKMLGVLVAAAAVSGCANRPSSIRASFVSHEKYATLDCTALQARMSSTREDLDKFSKLQDEKATGDAVGVFLVGVPFSKLSGDHEGEVARLKGEVEALDTAQIKAKCTDSVKVTAPKAAPDKEACFLGTHGQCLSR